MKFLISLILLLLVLRCRGEVELGTCSLQCDGGSSTTPGNLPPSLQGRPGKQGAVGDVGPIGQKGQKGEPAEICECFDVQAMKEAMFPQSCADIRSPYVSEKNGVHTIYPYGFNNLTKLRVYFDMVTDNDGWLVFQKRLDGSVDFFRNFDDYVKGFGNLDGEFWLGLDALHSLTKDGEYEMRVDMEDFENETRYALYKNFMVGKATDYTLTIGGYNGTAGDAMLFHQGAKFSAKDRDQDRRTYNCSQRYKGAFWYSSCHEANPNGAYLRGQHESFADGIEWKQWKGYHHSLKRIEMKLRKKL